MSREPVSGSALWITFGSIVLLAVCYLSALRGVGGIPGNPLVIAGTVAGFCGLLVGIFRNPTPTSKDQIAEGPGSHAAAAPPAVRPANGNVVANEVARRMVSTFRAWVKEQGSDGSSWGAFDQLMREMLTEHLSATRVRCYQVLAGSQQLRSLSQPAAAAADADHLPCAGILGHVATTGREFAAGNPAHGKLVDELADGTEESWAWVWPVRASDRQGQTIGLVAVGKLPSGSFVDRNRCQVIGPLITLLWEHVDAHERLRIAQKTDKASGVLTRFDFFESAARVLSDSYEQNEPVVAVVLALEGVRLLDDVGLWKQRDALVETLGRLVAGRVRTDDIVGRFSDDRFVVLLRRIDSGLGRLITEKVVATMEAYIGQLAQSPGPIGVRAGLAGSGLEQPSLKTLLVAASEAVQRARQQDEEICTDVRPLAAETASP